MSRLGRWFWPLGAILEPQVLSLIPLCGDLIYSKNRRLFSKCSLARALNCAHPCPSVFRPHELWIIIIQFPYLIFLLQHDNYLAASIFLLFIFLSRIIYHWLYSLRTPLLVTKLLSDYHYGIKVPVGHWCDDQQVYPLINGSRFLFIRCYRVLCLLNFRFRCAACETPHQS